VTFNQRLSHVAVAVKVHDHGHDHVDDGVA
jgi:hypothetical protein